MDARCKSMKIIVFISLLSFAFGRQLSEFNASTANSPNPWSVLILMSNYSAAGVCSGTAVGLQMVITAAHCMKGFDRVTVFSSNRTGGVNSTCLQRSTSSDMLFRPTSMVSLNKAINICGATAFAVSRTVLAPSNQDAAIVRVQGGNLRYLPIGSASFNSPVDVYGYGMTTPKQLGTVDVLHHFTGAPLDPTACSFVTKSLITPPSAEWMCLGHNGPTICEGDSGGGVIQTISGAPALVALNVEGTFSLAGQPCLLSSATLHLAISPLVGFLKTTANSWGQTLNVISTSRPPPPPALFKGNTAKPPAGTGMVFVRGISNGNNKTLWCEGVAVTANVVVTSASCIGHFTEFLLYNTSLCASYVGSRDFPRTNCALTTRGAVLTSKHPSWGQYTKSLMGGVVSRTPGVDLALLWNCGEPLAMAIPAVPQGPLYASPALQNLEQIYTFSDSDCTSLTAAFNRPSMLCSPSDARLNGDPVMSRGGVVAIKSLLFFASGLKGDEMAPQPFTVNTLLTPFTQWFNQPVPVPPRCANYKLGVPPSSETSSTSSEQAGVLG